MDALSAINTVRTPQTEPIPGRQKEMVRNNAGGFTFGKDLFTKLEDFLILGTTGGTYYVGEREHTYANAQVVFDAVTADGLRAVQLANNISVAGRAPKNFPALFVLAAAFARGDLDARRAARVALPNVARTTDHFAHFWGYYKNLKGKPSGRGSAPVMNRLMRSTLADWFTHDDPDRVAFRACKARARKTGSGEPFALKDMLRLAKPTTTDPRVDTLFGWLTGNVDDASAAEVLPSVEKFRIAKAVTRPAEAVTAVQTLRVPWEFLPDEVLDSPEVWTALAETVGMTALIRNLARMTRIGALAPFGKANATAVRRLTDAEALRKARVHPLEVYLALKVYNCGFAQPNPKAPARTWTPVAAISDALEEAYELCFAHAEPSGRKLLVAVDSSGSMTTSTGRVVLGGSPIGHAYEIACGLAVTMSRIEKGNVHVIDVDTDVHSSRVTPRTNLREIAGWRPSGGGTNLALPFAWAQRERMAVDGILVLTDNETWAGRQHPSQALAGYRAAVNPDARVIVASMTAAGHTIADPRDEGVLQVAGFDAALPQLVSGFLRGPRQDENVAELLHAARVDGSKQ
jgi:60 kDa SS-A/Ro ribonucleoprotein